MKKQSVLRGSVWLIGSALLAKLLGAVFRIPLTALLDGTGMGYFSCAYGLFLPVFALSVTGMNTAVSAVTAQSFAKHDSGAADRTRRIAFRMFGIGGAVCAILLFFAAEPLCCGFLHNPRAALAVRMFAPAVWFCCLNAVLRGIHEGSRSMIPTAVSQVTEGIGRVIFGLLLCSLVLQKGHLLLPYLPAGTTVPEAAAAAAILGVTLSTAVGLLTLLCFPKPCRSAAVPVYTPHSDRSLRHALLRILLPVAAASLVTNLTTLIDLATGMRLLERVILEHPARFGLSGAVTAAQAAEYANFRFGAFSGMAMTVFNLVPAVTNMLGKGVFPSFAASYVQHRTDETALQAARVMQRTAFLAIPAGCGMTVLSHPLLLCLFPTRQQETACAAAPLMILGIAVIFAALSYPLFSMLQASGHAGDTVSVMLCGAAVKLLCNLLLIPRFALAGTAISTAACYAAILILAMRRLRLRTGIRLHLLRLTGGMLFGGILCAAAAYAVYGRLLCCVSQRIALLCAVAAGGIVYLLTLLLLRPSPEQKKAAKPFSRGFAAFDSVQNQECPPGINNRKVHSDSW
ncbi:MAG: polysaccharide biosynthesis protein [Oscillospiraceae bacterium]|nr:polysaccharide biosynthesis protein [Oscillospiraceae bacterium]